MIKAMKMDYLLTGAEMASCDAKTSEVIGIPSLVLMERAALSVADGVDVFLQKNAAARRRGCRPLVLAAAGRGNNGADALAAGRILLDRGYDVRFVRLSGRISPESSFAVQENILRHYGAAVEEYPASLLAADGPGRILPDVIIDGLFGTGLSRNLTGEAAECVESINRCRDEYGSYVVAVDIPSGISSDDGRVMGCAVRCDETRTFAFYKRGHVMYPGAVYAGRLFLAQIGITERAFDKRPDMFTLRGSDAAGLLPARNPGGNKGTFGKVLLVAGRRNMCGAAILAARACMSAGAGMVKVFTHEANRLIIQQVIPEALLDTFSDEETPAQAAAKLRASLDWADIAAAGPAMGTDETAAALLREILLGVQKEDPDSAESAGKAVLPGRSDKTARRAVRGLVLDADAIRLLASDSSLRSLLAGRREEIPCVLTPHMAEFAALAGKSIADCLDNRTLLVQEEADLLGCTIACKDARTLVAQPCRGQKDTEEVEPSSGPKAAEGDQGRAGRAPRQYLNCTGNSGMSAAGSGDVLTGITAAFLALDFSDRTGEGGSTGAGDSTHSTMDETDQREKAAAEPPCASSAQAPLFSGAECRNGFAAAVSAVFLHGRAGDLAAGEHGQQGMTAGDLAEALRRQSFWK